MIYVKQYNAVESLAKRHPILVFSAPSDDGASCTIAIDGR